MLTYPKKADFYTRSATYNDYGEPVYTGTTSYSTGVRLSTLSYKDALVGTHFVDTHKFYCYTRKNTNTLTTVVGDYVIVDGVDHEVTGVDPKHGNRAEIMFLLDVVEDAVV
jgi:hypothetical protein